MLVGLQKLCTHLDVVATAIAVGSAESLQALTFPEQCRFTAGMGGWWSNTHKAQVTWGAAMRQYWLSRASVHSMPGTVHSGLESRSHGSQNTLQCMWSSLDEAQQAQMSAAVGPTVKRLQVLRGWSAALTVRSNYIASDLLSLLTCFVSITYVSHCLLQRI